jgi:hypothetical protein
MTEPERPDNYLAGYLDDWGPEGALGHDDDCECEECLQSIADAIEDANHNDDAPLPHDDCGCDRCQDEAEERYWDRRISRAEDARLWEPDERDWV